MPEPQRTIQHPHSYIAAALSLTALAGGLFMAAQHPLSPIGALLFLALWIFLALRRKPMWLFFLPAALPVIDLNAWSGWISFEEFDIAVLGILAGGYWRFFRSASWGVVFSQRSGQAFKYLFLAFTTWQLISMLHGIFASGDIAISGFGDYTSASNAWRIGKSSLFALLLAPLIISTSYRHRRQTLRYFERGMLAGLLLLCLAALWERAIFPGLLDFSEAYRTSALFWEMHVGGAAIDCYLVLALPFSIMAVERSRERSSWLAAAALLSAAMYVLLTTFSRGAYLASFVAIALLFWRFGVAGRLFSTQTLWRRKANIALAGLLALECAAVIIGGSFLLERVHAGGRDLIGRIQHWHEGIGLLDGPSQWLLGRGSGRFPGGYSDRYPSHTLPAAFSIRNSPGHGLYGVVYGPQHNGLYSGYFGAGQYLGAINDELLGIELDVRSTESLDFLVRVCEKHLIEEGDCLWERYRLESTDGSWQRVSLDLHEEGFGPFIRPAWLIVSVLTPGAPLEIDNFSLEGRDGPLRLRNPNFEEGQASWLLNGTHYFLPWHIDNLYLELLIDSGITGLGLFLAMLYALCRKAISKPFLYNSWSAYGFASVTGLLTSGIFVSVIDIPRVAFLFLMICIMLWGSSATGTSMNSGTDLSVK